MGEPGDMPGDEEVAGLRGSCNMGLMNQAPTQLHFVRATFGARRGALPQLRAISSWLIVPEGVGG
jgi:hypothetical protein